MIDGKRIEELRVQAELQGGGTVCLRGDELWDLLELWTLAGRLVECAEEVGFESCTGRRYTDRMVRASDLAAALGQLK